MPWHVDKSSECPAAKPWAVIKDDNGEIEGCHATKPRANRQMAALYANEGGRMDTERTDPETDEQEGLGENMPLYRQTPPDVLIFRDEAEPIVEGQVVPYNEWTEVDSVIEGHFMERFAPGSLTKTFAERVKLMKGYFEHGLSRMFDRMPIMDIREAWETDTDARYRAVLLESAPELLKEGLRRGLYGSSIGAKIVKSTRNRRPGKSDHNPEGLEERTYHEVRAFDISITPRPQYASAFATLRSINDDLILERLLEDPRRLIDAIVSRTETAKEEKEVTEPQHSGREEPEDPDPQRSRSTQPSRDYLRPREERPSWLLKRD